MNYSTEDNEKRKKSATSKPKKRRNRLVTIGLRVIISTIIISIFAVGGMVVGAYLGIIENVQDMRNLSVTPNMFNTVVLDMHGQEAFRYYASENREFVPLSEMPRHLLDAFVAIEDQRFFEHNGVDARGTVRAVYSTVLRGTTEGGSTITQQLVKNNIMDLQRNTIETKLQEQFLAVRLERELTEALGSTEAAKMYILEQYLNSIALGNNLNGVQTAARFYFNKDASELTLSESAVIASITQRPTDLDPSRNPENNRRRQVTVLNRMLEQGLITESQHRVAMADPVHDRIGHFRESLQGQVSIHSYFSDALFEQLVRDLIDAGHATNVRMAQNIIFNGGLTIYSTLDPNIQDIMEDAFMNDSLFPNIYQVSLEYFLSIRNSSTGSERHEFFEGNVNTWDNIEGWMENHRNNVLEANPGYTVLAERILPTIQPQAAMVVIDHHVGQVRGVVGGRGEKLTDRGLNRIHSPRQIGSTFKMVAVYAPAFDLGILSPGAILRDEPWTFNDPWSGNWTPRNHTRAFEGNVTVRHAVAQSLNVVAARTMTEYVGIDVAFDYLLNFGFSTLVEADRVPSMALGGITHGVSQLETAAAFATMANSGEYIQPMFYTKVLDHQGNILLDGVQERRQVLMPETAYMLTTTMEDVLTRGTGGRARLNTSMAVAGKTGTTNDSHDLTFAGYTPYFTASIWMGHDRPEVIRSPGNAHLTVWAHVMNRIHEDLPLITSFEQPGGMIYARVCMDSGMLAAPGLCEHDHRGSRVRGDTFNPRLLPTRQCTLHQRFLIDTATGLPPTASTPAYRQATVIGLLNERTNAMWRPGDDDYLNEGNSIPAVQGEPESYDYEPIIETPVEVPVEMPVVTEAPMEMPVVTPTVTQAAPEWPIVAPEWPIVAPPPQQPPPPPPPPMTEQPVILEPVLPFDEQQFNALPVIPL